MAVVAREVVAREVAVRVAVVRVAVVRVAVVRGAAEKACGVSSLPRPCMGWHGESFGSIRRA